MFIRKYWVPLSVFLLLIMGVSVYYLQNRPPKDPIVIYKTTPVEVEKPPTPAVPVDETDKGGHVHEDGTWHEGPHEAHTPPAAPNTAPSGAATTPDFPSVDPNEDPVEAAYKRLEYIKNNPYAWGGVHSERATQLIAELMPPTQSIDHAAVDEIREQIEELIAENDPRTAEYLITEMCEGYRGGGMMTDALVAIGPPAVPYILPYLEKGVAEGGVMSIGVFRSLSRIGAAHRGDLGGVLDHIIIPKLEVIAADEDHVRYSPGAVIDAREALAVLRR